MDTKTLARRKRVVRRYSAEQREELIDSFEKSGQTVAVFCSEHDLHPVTFGGWLKHREPLAAGFTEVKVPVSSESPIEVELPGKVRVKVRTCGDTNRTAKRLRQVVGLEALSC